MAQYSVADDHVISISIEQVFIRLLHLLVALFTEQSRFDLEEILARGYFEKFGDQEPRIAAF